MTGDICYSPICITFNFGLLVLKCNEAEGYHFHPDCSNLEREYDGDDSVYSDAGQHEDGYLTRPHRADPHRLTQPTLPPIIRIHYVPEISNGKFYTMFDSHWKLFSSVLLASLGNVGDYLSYFTHLIQKFLFQVCNQ